MPETVVTAPVPDETILLMDRLEFMPVKLITLQLEQPQTQFYIRLLEEFSTDGVIDALTKAWSLSTGGETS